MRYLPILEELCSSDSVLLMVAGVIVALVISVKFCDYKKKFDWIDRKFCGICNLRGVN